MEAIETAASRRTDQRHCVLGDNRVRDPGRVDHPPIPGRPTTLATLNIRSCNIAVVPA